MRLPGQRAGSIALCAALAAGCGGTVDSIGYNGTAGIVLHPLSGPASYPSAFRDLLGKTDADITTKINAAFNQLFHGDAGTQAIYATVGTDQVLRPEIVGTFRAGDM